MNNITIDSPEFKKMYEEVSELAEAKRKRQELSDTAFRDWICIAIEELARQLGYHIQNLVEFTLDMGYSFKKGFAEGRKEAHRRSLRYREGNDN